jgi:hypothetical protein
VAGGDEPRTVDILENLIIAFGYVRHDFDHSVFVRFRLDDDVSDHGEDEFDHDSISDAVWAVGEARVWRNAPPVVVRFRKDSQVPIEDREGGDAAAADHRRPIISRL